MQAGNSAGSRLEYASGKALYNVSANATDHHFTYVILHGAVFESGGPRRTVFKPGPNQWASSAGDLIQMDDRWSEALYPTGILVSIGIVRPTGVRY